MLYATLHATTDGSKELLIQQERIIA